MTQEGLVENFGQHSIYDKCKPTFDLRTVRSSAKTIFWWMSESQTLEAIDRFGLKGLRLPSTINEASQQINQFTTHSYSLERCIINSGIFDPNEYQLGTFFRYYENNQIIFDPEMPEVLLSRIIPGEMLLSGIRATGRDRFDGITGHTGLIVRSPDLKENLAILLEDKEPGCNENSNQTRCIYGPITLREWDHFVGFWPRFWGLNKTRMDIFQQVERIEIIQTPLALKGY